MVSIRDLFCPTLLSIGEAGLGTGVVPLSISSSTPVVIRSCDGVGGDGVEIIGGVGVVMSDAERALSSNSV